MQLCKKSGHKIISREKFEFLVISLEIGKPHFKVWSLSDHSLLVRFGFYIYFVVVLVLVLVLVFGVIKHITCAVRIKYKIGTVLNCI